MTTQRNKPDMTRAERLGLEPGSTNPNWHDTAQPHEPEIEHSIAISLKRIADSFEHAENYGRDMQP